MNSTLVASLTGRPKRDMNNGSTWAAIERIDDRVDEIDGDFARLSEQSGALSTEIRVLLNQTAIAQTNSGQAMQHVTALQRAGGLVKSTSLKPE